MAKERNDSGLRKLTKVRGKSFEDVTGLLEKAGIKFNVNCSGEMVHGYFRYSNIFVDDNECSQNEFIEALGNPHSTKRNHVFYRAEYEIGEGFDSRVLSGTFLFSEGRLVERVEVVSV